MNMQKASVVLISGLLCSLIGMSDAISCTRYVSQIDRFEQEVDLTYKNFGIYLY